MLRCRYEKGQNRWERGTRGGEEESRERWRETGQKEKQRAKKGWAERLLMKSEPHLGELKRKKAQGTAKLERCACRGRLHRERALIFSGGSFPVFTES